MDMTRHDVIYGRASLGGVEVDLPATLFLPDKGMAEAPPLFVWFHAGAFKFGSHDMKIARRLGRRLTKAGIAVASVGYRLRATEADLSEQVRAHLAALQAERANLIRPGLCEARSLAALEDGLKFLDWASGEGARYGWGQALIAGGASAGGLTAFNLAFSPPALGLAPARLNGVYASSGGYNYPALVAGNDRMIALAQHDPGDPRVSVKGVRMLKRKMGDRMTLIEMPGMLHGHLELRPDEKPAATFERLAAFIHKAARRPPA